MKWMPATGRFFSEVLVLMTCMYMHVRVVPWQVLQSSWKMELNCVCFSPTQRCFLVGDNMGEVQCWDLTAIKVIRSF